MKLLLAEDGVSLTDFARKTREHTESLAKIEPASSSDSKRQGGSGGHVDGGI